MRDLLQRYKLLITEVLPPNEELKLRDTLELPASPPLPDQKPGAAPATSMAGSGSSQSAQSRGLKSGA